MLLRLNFGAAELFVLGIYKCLYILGFVVIFLEKSSLSTGFNFLDSDFWGMMRS